MKKALRLLASISVVIMAISAFMYVQINKPYTEIINKNWSVKLPNTYKEIYSSQGEVTFTGDGPRYHILEYKNEKDINLSVNWENNKNVEIEKAAMKVLNTLNISKDNIPNFRSEYKYYTKDKDGPSKMYLIFFIDTKKLYVIENIF